MRDDAPSNRNGHRVVGDVSVGGCRVGHLHDVGARLRVVIGIDGQLVEVAFEEDWEGLLVLNHVRDRGRLIAAIGSYDVASTDLRAGRLRTLIDGRFGNREDVRWDLFDCRCKRLSGWLLPLEKRTLAHWREDVDNEVFDEGWVQHIRQGHYKSHSMLANIRVFVHRH